MEKLAPCPECGSENIKTVNEYIAYADCCGHRTFCGDCGCGDAGCWLKKEIVNSWNKFVDNYFVKCCGEKPIVRHDVRKSKNCHDPMTSVRCKKCESCIEMNGLKAVDRFNTVRMLWNTTRKVRKELIEV